MDFANVTRSLRLSGYEVPVEVVRDAIQAEEDRIFDASAVPDEQLSLLEEAA